MGVDEQLLQNILATYSKSFSDKAYSEENNDLDVLMSAFAITPEMKRENRQYWGRELGMCWQLLVTEVFKQTRGDFARGLRDGSDELCDLFCGADAIDTKYRIGSGDSGTLKKFKTYGRVLQEQNYHPLLLILREDNLGAAITACRAGGWKILTGQNSFGYIKEKTGFPLDEWLVSQNDVFQASLQVTKNSPG